MQYAMVDDRNGSVVGCNTILNEKDDVSEDSVFLHNFFKSHIVSRLVF